MKQISGFGSKRPQKGNFSLVLMRVMQFLTFLLVLQSTQSYTESPLRLTHLTNKGDKTHHSCVAFAHEVAISYLLRRYFCA